MLPQPPDTPSYLDDTGATITAVVRMAVYEKMVPRIQTQEMTGPVLLQTVDGVYFGNHQAGTSTSPSRAWFVFWDEIIAATIPLSMAPPGHPLA